jgi:hypothetical protein
MTAEPVEYRSELKVISRVIVRMRYPVLAMFEMRLVMRFVIYVQSKP